jgi:hypothetical protein
MILAKSRREVRGGGSTVGITSSRRPLHQNLILSPFSLTLPSDSAATQRAREAATEGLLAKNMVCGGF